MRPKARRPKPVKLNATARAKASGFPAKLRRWFGENRENYEAGRGETGPKNGRQLSKLLTARGEPITEAAVGQWRRGRSMPDPRYIGHIERLMGAPWSYLDDPETAWPRPLTKQTVAEMLQLFPDDAIQRFVERLRLELVTTPRRSGR